MSHKIEGKVFKLEKWDSKLSLNDDAETFFKKLLDERYKDKCDMLLENFYKCVERVKNKGI